MDALEHMFFTPGRLVLKFKYLFPKTGKDLWHGANQDNRVLQFVYSLGFWAAVVIFVAAITGLLDEKSPQRQTAQGPRFDQVAATKTCTDAYQSGRSVLYVDGWSGGYDAAYSVCWTDECARKHPEVVHCVVH